MCTEWAFGQIPRRRDLPITRRVARIRVGKPVRVINVLASTGAKPQASNSISLGLSNGEAGDCRHKRGRAPKIRTDRAIRAAAGDRLRPPIAA